MADRFFPNQMPDFVPESATTASVQVEEEVETGHGIAEDSLTKLLCKPHAVLSETFETTALDLKETVVMNTWGLSGRRVRDYTLYCGTLGTAFLLLKSHKVTGNEADLRLCCEIVEACNYASLGSRDVTFICGRAGICAVGAAAAKSSGDEKLLNYHLNQFAEIKLPRYLPDELLYGRAGFLWAASFLNKHIGAGTIPSSYTETVVSDIIENGRKMGNRRKCPLMFEWYGEKYWGAAHGLAGIMHVLMDFNLKPDDAEDVKGTLRYMIQRRFQSGNYPTSEDDRDDCRVHWCHGAPGVALTLAKAAEVFGDGEFLGAAIEAAQIVWKRGLLKRVGICHGISGNAYAFLSLYRLTGKVEFLYKAKAFACFLVDRTRKLVSEGQMHGGDAPFSMFEGMGGMAYLLLDMVKPMEARFPGYEL